VELTTVNILIQHGQAHLTAAQKVVMPPGVIGVVAPPPTNVDWAKETVTVMITVLVIGYVEVQATVEILILVGLILPIAAVKNKNLVKINPPK